MVAVGRSLGIKSMSAAKKTDWKTKELPSARSTILLSRTFSADEMRCMREGLVPQQMEDKWFIYRQDDALYFHRSWTGFCIYIVRFAAEGDSFRMVEADVNRDPEQYGETDDARDAKMISFLIDMLLLRQRGDYPSKKTDPEMEALEQWSLVGRAMLGQHPKPE